MPRTLGYSHTIEDIFDGAMIVLAMYTLNFFHPALLLGNADKWGDKEVDYIQTSDDSAVELSAKNRFAAAA